MEAKKSGDQKVEVNFESHPPIQEDHDGIVTLLRQTFLSFIDTSPLAKHLIFDLNDVTQIIALEDPEEENVSEDDEPDDNIYGVSSVINLGVENESAKDYEKETKKQLKRFLAEKCPDLKKLLDSTESKSRIGLMINERYINLPPQLALSTFTNLTQHLNVSKFTHLVFMSKVLLKSRNTNTSVQSKKVKPQSTKETNVEPIIYVNSEEEIIYEDCDSFTDIDVSAQCDENATWSLSSDIKYIPHRRIMLLDCTNWPKILKNLEKELN